MRWTPNAFYEGVTHYEVYEESTGTNVLVGLVYTNRAVILNLTKDKHCFSVIAVNFYGASEASSTECITLQSDSLGGVPVLDQKAPTSQMQPLPTEVDYLFDVSWSGADEVGGSGLDAYDVYVSVNDGPYNLWLAGTRQTRAEFSGYPGNRYGFYTVASDLAGNRQPPVNTPQASTKAVSLNQPPQFQSTALLSANVNQPFFAQIKATDIQNSRPKPVAYSIESSEGTDITIEPTLGVLHWMPTRIYAGKTLQFGIRATDYGIPSLSATQVVLVKVSDYFELQAGTTAVPVSETALLPLSAFSSVRDWGVEMYLEALTFEPVELSFVEVDGKSCFTYLVPMTSQRWMLFVQSCGSGLLRADELFGRLQIRKIGPKTGIVPLLLQNLTVTRLSGGVVPITGAMSGQVVFLGEQPILQGRKANAGMDLDLFGNMQQSYVLEVNTESLADNNWEPLWSGSLDTNTHKHFFIPSVWTDHAYFRARIGTP